MILLFLAVGLAFAEENRIGARLEAVVATAKIGVADAIKEERQQEARKIIGERNSALIAILAEFPKSEAENDLTRHDFEAAITSCELLMKWGEGVGFGKRCLKRHPASQSAVMGAIRCLVNLRQLDSAIDLLNKYESKFDVDSRVQFARSLVAIQAANMKKDEMAFEQSLIAAGRRVDVASSLMDVAGRATFDFERIARVALKINRQDEVSRVFEKWFGMLQVQYPTFGAVITKRQFNVARCLARLQTDLGYWVGAKAVVAPIRKWVDVLLSGEESDLVSLGAWKTGVREFVLYLERQDGVFTPQMTASIEMLYNRLKSLPRSKTAQYGNEKLITRCLHLVEKGKYHSRIVGPPLGGVGTLPPTGSSK